MSISPIVLGRGRMPNSLMIVGEAPGKEEAYKGRPFVGKSGQEQDAYLGRYGLHSSQAYVTNVMKLYQDGNPDPTPAQIEEWSPVLRDEITRTNPRLIIAVGRFAARWFLGPVDMEAVHGMACRSDKTSAIVVPVYHPALGFYDGEMRAAIAWDYGRACTHYNTLMKGGQVEVAEDKYAGKEKYVDVSGEDLALWLSVECPEVIGLDTEGSIEAPWSIQVSTSEGTGYVLRCGRTDFDEGIRGLRHWASHPGAVVAIHNAMFDVGMARAMGLDLSVPTVRLWDTMYAAYLMRLEPQALKSLASRWLGTAMTSYTDTVGDAGSDRQLEYLLAVSSREWPEPEPMVVESNDGSVKLYKPRAIHKSAAVIYNDWLVDRSVDMERRWKQIEQPIREGVEKELGPIPVGTLDDVPLDRAVRYSARDADVTLRLYHAMRPVLGTMDLTRTMSDCMDVLPIFEEMQATGVLASRSAFEKLEVELDKEMKKIQRDLSRKFYQGKPFNPGSSKQVGALLRRRGLQSAHRTPTGVPSTGKKGIEHLRDSDPAVGLIMDWRENQKIRDAYCKPALARAASILGPSDGDLFDVRGQIKPTRTATRRLSMADPNLLQIPARSDTGKKVRECYVAPEGQVYGAWDLSQIELRLTAHVSQDKLMCRLIREGADLHTETAMRLFGVTRDTMDKSLHRLPAKTINFGVLYGVMGSGLYTQFQMLHVPGQWSADACQRLIDDWFDLYTGVKAYVERTAKEVEKVGYVRDMWGMYRHLPGITSSDVRVRAEAARIAVSHRIQGGAQGMIQNSMAWLRPVIRGMQQDGMNVHWVLQIHDEIVLRFDEELWPILDPIIQYALTEEHRVEGMLVPVESSGNCAKTWGGLK